MGRIGLGVAAAALVALSACGGSDGGGSGDEKRAEGAPTLDLLTAGQACAQVQMVNDETDGPGNWPLPTYGEYGAKIAPLADESVPEIANALETISTKAVEVGEMRLDTDSGIDAATQAVGEWSAEYEKVADICARTDSPIARIDY